MRSYDGNHSLDDFSSSPRDESEQSAVSLIADMVEIKSRVDSVIASVNLIQDEIREICEESEFSIDILLARAVLKGEGANDWFESTIHIQQIPPTLLLELTLQSICDLMSVEMETKTLKILIDIDILCTKFSMILRGPKDFLRDESIALLVGKDAFDRYSIESIQRILENQEISEGCIVVNSQSNQGLALPTRTVSWGLMPDSTEAVVIAMDGTGELKVRDNKGYSYWVFTESVIKLTSTREKPQRTNNIFDRRLF